MVERLMDAYRPHARKWLEREYGGEHTEREVESLTYLLAGCFSDGDNRTAAALALIKRAREVVQAINSLCVYTEDCCGVMDETEATALIADALTEARREERERCIRIALERGASQGIAAAIRANDYETSRQTSPSAHETSASVKDCAP